MTGPLQDQAVLVIGRGGGLARAITIAARDAGARVTAAGRDQRALAAAYAGEPGISTETVDLTDEASIAALGKRLDTVGHVVSTASARARGRVAGPGPGRDPAVVRHQGDRPAHAGQAPGPADDRRRLVRPVLRVAAAKITVGTLGVAITNAAADTLARSLALELAPIRVNAISPGVIDTGAWDALGEQGKADYFAADDAPATRPGASAPPTTSPTASCSP